MVICAFLFFMSLSTINMVIKSQKCDTSLATWWKPLGVVISILAGPNGDTPGVSVSDIQRNGGKMEVENAKGKLPAV